MVRTLINEWAYSQPFTDTSQRIAALDRFLDFYNHRRPHWSLAGARQQPDGEEHLATVSTENG